MNSSPSKERYPQKAVKKFTKPAHREIAVGILIAYGLFPRTNEGIAAAQRLIAGRETWLAPSSLPNYYNDIDSDLMTGKETAGIINIRMILKEFYGLVKETPKQAPVDEVIEKKEDLVQSPKRNVNHPKLFPELQYIKTRYMWGQNGLYDLEFESDIDRAIYFAGKLGGDDKDKISVREWLFLATGLNVRDDYDEIKEYRKKILTTILELIKSNPNERDVIVPSVYDGYYQDPEEDEEDEYLEEDESVIDDDLLNLIREEEQENREDLEEAKEQAETATEVLEEAEQVQEEIDLSDLPEDMIEDLYEIINQKRRESATPKKPSSYKTNKEIFEFMKSNFLKIQGQLTAINESIKHQNELILTNTQALVSTLQVVESQDSLIVDKLDSILQAYNIQTEQAKKVADEAENAAAEQALEAKRDAASTFAYEDLIKGGGKKGRENKIEKYFKSKLTKKMYRKLPKSLRNSRKKLRKLQRIPGKVKTNVANKMTSMLPSKGKQVTRSLSKIRGMGKIGRVTGPARYVFAGLEYSERKQSGQNEVQALSGIGGGLAGAAAGGAAGAKLGATIGAAIGVWFGGVGAGPGAAIGGVLGGLLGSIGGGIAGSGIADKITGAHETGSGLTEPGTAILHGTELILDKDKISPLNDIGAALISSTMSFVSGMGPVASTVAPVIRQMAAPLTKVFDVPTTLATTTAGGSFPSVGTSLEKKKEKRRFEGEFYEQHDKGFVDKLMNFLQNPIQSLLDAIENKTSRPSENIPGAEYTGAVSGETFNPLPGGSIGKSAAQQYGASRDGGDRSHAGVDITEHTLKDSRAPVVAYKTGKVTELSPNANAPGGIVGLDHGGGLQTRYVHVTPVSGLKIGDTIYGGQKLGNLYRYFSGQQEQTHLHFEIYVNDKLANPTSYIQNVKNNLPKPLSAERAKQLYESETKSLPAMDSPVGTPPPAADLGKQNVMGNKDFGAISGVGSKGYIIIPGHATGGGAPGEKEMVKSLARNAYNNIKAKNPNAKVLLMDLDSQFDDTDAGWEKQKRWYSQKESEGYEILEIHLDAKGGTGKGVIVPHKELNPVEKEFARKHGAYDRNWRSKPGEKPLAAPSRGVSMFELGNVPENMTQAVMNYMTAPLEESVLKSMSSISPASSPRPRIQTLNARGTDKKSQYVIVNQQAKPQAPTTVSGVEFVPMSPGRWRTRREVTERTIELLRLGMGN